MSEIHKIKHELDVQLIGSDISIRAVETASNNVTHANLDSYQDLFNVSERQVINEPLVFCEHWPKSFTQHDSASSNQLINFGDVNRRCYLSLYHGDFNVIGQKLRALTNDLEHFTVLMNIPYGEQSATNQHKTIQDTQNLYRRLGKFLRSLP